MSDRHDLPKIKPTDEPSFFNREAGNWGMLASFVGSIAALATPVGAMARQGIFLASTAIGTVFGGIKGMSRQKQEHEEGRTVKDPTYWNEGIWSGLLAAQIIHAPLRYMNYAGKPVPSVLAWGGELINPCRRSHRQHPA